MERRLEGPLGTKLVHRGVSTTRSEDDEWDVGGLLLTRPWAFDQSATWAGNRQARERPRAKGRGRSHTHPVIVTDVGVSVAMPESETDHAIAATNAVPPPNAWNGPRRCGPFHPLGTLAKPGRDWDIPGHCCGVTVRRATEPWPIWE